MDAVEYVKESQRMCKTYHKECKLPIKKGV
jgi:hypothetical protein